MSRSDYFNLVSAPGLGEISLTCTDYHTLRDMVDEVKIQYPSCQVKDSLTLFDDRKYACTISRLPMDKGVERAFLWLTRQLCEHGWAPFSHSPGGRIGFRFVER
jgi:hypothetical protein